MPISDTGLPTSTPTPSVRVEHAGENVMLVTLDRPHVRNAVDSAIAQALELAVLQTEADEDVRVVVLTGAGPVFCAGADLRELSTRGAAGLRTPSGGFAGFVRQPRTKPWIAAVNGPALAGGCEIALACDLILAADTASFGLPEALRGLVASAGGAFRLARALPRGLALEMLMTGAPIDAERAARHGLVNAVLAPADLLAAALRLATTIAAAAPLAVRESRRLALACYDCSEEELFAHSDEARERIAKSEDYKEGPRAFLEKRSPKWRGC